ncbi:unnamed protein product, partial [Tetraodon nigroviridis]
PSLLEYLSYNLNFLSILVGPCSNYRDYLDFIEGGHIRRRLRPPASACNGHKRPRRGPEPDLEPGPGPEPSPLVRSRTAAGLGGGGGANLSRLLPPQSAVCQKLLVCCGCVLFFLLVTRSLPIKANGDAAFVRQNSFLVRLTYAFFSIQAARPKFYFAWMLAGVPAATLTNVLLRLLFLHQLRPSTTQQVTASRGWMKRGNRAGTSSGTWTSWGSRLRPVSRRSSTTGTSRLRFGSKRCVTTGPHRHRLALTFILSALWHGVLPGYYFTFITAIPITMAARAIRKSLRHYFLRSRGLKLGYDVVTWASTQLAICYTVMPFLLLSVESTFIYYRCVRRSVSQRNTPELHTHPGCVSCTARDPHSGTVSCRFQVHVLPRAHY